MERDKVMLAIDRTLAGLQAKVNRLVAEGYATSGSFNRTRDGRWFMQTMEKIVPAETVEVPPAPEVTEIATAKATRTRKSRPTRRRG